jgi:hypothetical protein
MAPGTKRAAALTGRHIFTTFKFSMSQTIKDKIIEQVDRLDEYRRKQVLDFARRLTAPSGTPGHSLMDFVCSIDPADLDAMANAIQEGCEKVDSNAW